MFFRDQSNELNNRLIHQQLPSILRDDSIRKGKRLERGIIEYDLLPAVVEDRDLALVLLIEVALHVQLEEHGLASLPDYFIIGVSHDLVHDEFNITDMQLLISDEVCIKDEYDFCFRLIELMQIIIHLLLLTQALDSRKYYSCRLLLSPTLPRVTLTMHDRGE